MLGKLRGAPQSRAGDAEVEARRAIALALVAAALRPIVAKISELTREIAHRVRAHRDGHVFLSLLRDPKSVVCAAALLAEIGDCRARYRSAEALAADAGMSPVAVESSKRKVATFRRGCDHRLRAATSTLADATRHWHPWAADRYATARDRGQDHQHAIRTLGRAWCRVLWRCWQDGVAYDPAKHHGLQEHIAVAIPSQSSPRQDLTATQRTTGAAVTNERREAPSAKRSTASRHPLPTRRVDTGPLMRVEARWVVYAGWLCEDTGDPHTETDPTVAPGHGWHSPPATQSKVTMHLIKPCRGRPSHRQLQQRVRVG